MAFCSSLSPTRSVCSRLISVSRAASIWATVLSGMGWPPREKIKGFRFKCLNLASPESCNQNTVDDTRFSTSDSSIIFTGFVM